MVYQCHSIDLIIFIIMCVAVLVDKYEHGQSVCETAWTEKTFPCVLFEQNEIKFKSYERK